MTSPTPLASQSTMVFLNTMGTSCIKQLMMPYNSFKNMVIQRYYESGISRMPFARFRSVLSTTGYSFSNGRESYPLTFSYHLDYVRRHSFSIYSARDYIGSRTGSLAELSFIIWMTSYLSMILIQSSSILSLRTLASQRISRNERMDGLLISQALNLTLISWRLDCQKTNTIVPPEVYKIYSPLAQ